MEMRFVYFLWALLPLWYFFQVLWVYLRPMFKATGQEKVKDYAEPLLYTSGLLALAVIIDQQFDIMSLVGSLLSMTGFFGQGSEIDILRFLLYPLVLVVAASIQSALSGEEEVRKKNISKSRWGT